MIFVPHVQQVTFFPVLSFQVRPHTITTFLHLTVLMGEKYQALPACTTSMLAIRSGNKARYELFLWLRCIKMTTVFYTVRQYKSHWIHTSGVACARYYELDS